MSVKESAPGMSVAKIVLTDMKEKLQLPWSQIQQFLLAPPAGLSRLLPNAEYTEFFRSPVSCSTSDSGTLFAFPRLSHLSSRTVLPCALLLVSYLL